MSQTLALKRGWLAIMSSMVAATMLIGMVPAASAEETSEDTQSVDFWCQLQELSSTDLPTTIVCRKDPAGEFTDYTVEIPVGTSFGTWSGNRTSMEDWITGDSLHVIGTQNLNTNVVTASIVINSSMNPFNYKGLNGWITAIDEDASTMTVQWQNVEHVVNVTGNTHMVVPPTNPAALSDFEIGDRVRVRIIKDSDVENEARIIVALRRGDHIFLMARTRGFLAELTDIDENDDGTGDVTVTLLKNEHLRSGDVNNLIGVEGDEITVTYDANTKFVRRYNGITEPSEFVEGDFVFVVGRYNDDGTVSARLIKDTNIWRLGVARHAGEVTSIDTGSNTIVVDPIEKQGADRVTSLTISYDDDTKFFQNGEEISENDIEVGDVIHVRGTASLRGGVLSIDNVESIGVKGDDEVENHDGTEEEVDAEDDDEVESDDDSDEDVDVEDVDEVEDDDSEEEDVSDDSSDESEDETEDDDDESETEEDEDNS
jgi:hypothetical protein